MTDELDPLHAEGRTQAFLKQAEHQKPKGGRPEHIEDDAGPAIAIESHLGAPDWHAEGKATPAGWHQAGDTFEEDH